MLAERRNKNTEEEKKIPAMIDYKILVRALFITNNPLLTLNNIQCKWESWRIKLNNADVSYSSQERMMEKVSFGVNIRRLKKSLRAYPICASPTNISLFTFIFLESFICQRQSIPIARNLSTTVDPSGWYLSEDGLLLFHDGLLQEDTRGWGRNYCFQRCGNVTRESMCLHGWKRSMRETSKRTLYCEFRLCLQVTGPKWHHIYSILRLVWYIQGEPINWLSYGTFEIKCSNVCSFIITLGFKLFWLDVCMYVLSSWENN